MYICRRNRYQSELPKAIEKPWMNLSALVTISTEPPLFSVRFEKLGHACFLAGPIQTRRKKGRNERQRENALNFLGNGAPVNLPGFLRRRGGRALSILNAGGDRLSDVERITNATWSDWHTLAGTMIQNGFRFRAREIDTALYGKFRPILLARKNLCTLKGKEIDFTTMGENVLRTINHLPIEPRSIPESVYRRLTHTTRAQIFPLDNL